MYKLVLAQPGFAGDHPALLARLPGMQASIDAGIAYVRRHLGPGGRMRYKVLVPSGEAGDGYNIMRHSGLLAEMCRARLTGLSPAEDVGMIHSLAEYLTSHVVALGSDESLCTDRPVDRWLKLGQTALAVVPLAGSLHLGVAEAETRRMQIRGMANHLLKLQRADGSLPSKYREGSQEASAFKSNYYPGQAAMALVAASELFQESRYLEGAMRVARYQAEHEFEGISFREFSRHWDVLAIASLDHLQPGTYWHHFILRLLDWLDALPVMNGDQEVIQKMCTTDLACRTEAFAVLGQAAHAMGRRQTAARIATCCRSMMAACVARQVPSDGCEGIDGRLNGGFLPRAHPEGVCIDHVQHCLGGMFSYLELAGQLAGPDPDPAVYDMPEAGASVLAWTRPPQSATKVNSRLIAEPQPMHR